MVYNNDNQPPEIWIKEEKQTEKISSNEAGFTEYLRWMRAPKQVVEGSDDRYVQQESRRNKENNQNTQLQILQLTAQKAKGYQNRLKEYNARTELIAGQDNTFEAECSWRIRVGGERGPENILLPAFNALGIPYISSATLRGVARSQAFWEISQNIINDIIEQKGEISEEEVNKAKQKAEEEVSSYFGSLDVSEEHRTGKVIFLDAYPLHNHWGIQNKGLALDMANNIWKWNGNEPEYKPNPNTFLSLSQPRFLIGLRPSPRGKGEVFEQVKGWLIRGLQNGIGSQVNTGYGEMSIKKQPVIQNPFLQLRFMLTGQLIHGAQKITNPRQPFKVKNGQTQTNQLDTYPEPEARPVAFKSMLRYWFRTLALGFLDAGIVKTWENRLFGGIQPQEQGWIKCQLADTVKARQNTQDLNQDCLCQKGTLKLSHSREVPLSAQETVEKLTKNLAWLMFHLGGVGQGARRPLYSRKNRQNPKPPYYRGCDLKVDSTEDFWNLPESIQDFQTKFRQRLNEFYFNLFELTGQNFDVNTPLNLPANPWREAIDANCRIVICGGEEENNKPHALAILHSDELKIEKENKNGNLILDYDKRLCGESSDRSPVWIANLGHYQVVTVFGANVAPRRNYLELLEQESGENQYFRIFPFD